MEDAEVMSLYSKYSGVLGPVMALLDCLLKDISPEQYEVLDGSFSALRTKMAFRGLHSEEFKADREEYDRRVERLKKERPAIHREFEPYLYLSGEGAWGDSCMMG